MQIEIEKVTEVPAGELVVERTPGIIGCLLGSCVAVVLWDVSLKTGGIAHISLPQSIKELGKVANEYADVAVPCLIEKMIKTGALKRNLRCAVFGGANMFKNCGALDVGRKNIESVRANLHAGGIKISLERLGGKEPHRVLLATEKGIIYYERGERQGEKLDLKAASL